MPSNNADASAPTVRLTELPNGSLGRVQGLEGKFETCQRLREMGFCESALIERVSGAHTLLCQVCGTRIALSDRIAQSILVEPVRKSA